MKREMTMRRLFAATIATLITATAISACGGTERKTSLSFERQDGAFAAGENLSLEECYRNSLLDDNIRRPFARTLDPVDPITISKTGDITGDTKNLSDHWYNRDISICWISIGAPALAVADLNSDGFDDVIKSPNQVWMNDKAGGFTVEYLPIKNFGEKEIGSSGLKVPLFERWSGSPAIADLNRDGNMEIISVFKAGPTQEPYQVFSNVDGKWQIVTERYAPKLDTKFFGNANSIAVFDYNNDGWVDLGVSFAGRDTVTNMNRRSGFDTDGLMILQNEQGGGFRDVTRELGIPRAIEQIVDEDLWAGTISKYWNPHTYAHAMISADLDNDSYPDLVVAGDYGTGMLLWNEGGKGFTADLDDDFRGFAAMGPAVSDVNDDGYLDVFVTQIQSEIGFTGNNPGGRPSSDAGTRGNLWMISDGNRGFTDKAAESGLLKGGWGWGATFVDFDNDGYDELVQAAGYTGTLSPGETGWLHRKDAPRLFQRTDVTGTSQLKPAGSWSEVAGAAGVDMTAPTGGVAVSDFDRDGRVDFVLATGNQSKPVLYRNTTADTENWLEVTPTGANGEEIWGARVTVATQDRTQFKLSGTQSQSFMSNGTPRLWFGVGDHKTVNITVRFPDGSEQSWNAVKVKQSIKLAKSSR